MSNIQSNFTIWKTKLPAADAEKLDLLDQSAIEDAFFRDLSFGTGGLRGRLGLGPNRINIYTVGKATQGLADYLNASCENPSVALCRDTRHGSEEFVRKVASVLAANGVRSFLYERVEPTPALSYAVRYLHCSAGVNITASHNPAAYNGYKVYGPDGCQITVAAAKSIQSAIDAVDAFADVKDLPFEEALASGMASWCIEDVLDSYIADTLRSSTGTDCSGLKVVYTPLHGVGLECVSRALGSIGVGDVTVVEEQAVQDGDFPTCPYPNPEIRDALRLGLEYCDRVEPDLLLATDPDTDRVGIAVPHGGSYELLSGNEVGLLLLDFLATCAQSAGEDLSRKVACTTVVSAPMADDIARERGLELRRTLTGFKFIGEQIGALESQGRETDFLMGFEESYGYLAGTCVRDKDAVVSSMLICELAAYWKARGRDLYGAMESLYERYGFWGNRLLSVAYEGPEGAEDMAAVMAGLREASPNDLAGIPVARLIDYASGVPMPTVNLFDGVPAQRLPPADVVELRLEGGSRVIFRPSGTEPKAKAYVFARAVSRSEAEGLTKSLSAAAETILKGDK